MILIYPPAKHSSDAKLRLLQCAGLKVFETVKGLVFEAYHLQEKGGGSMDMLAPITGRVWEACEEMKQIPVENNQCASIATRQEIRILKASHFLLPGPGFSPYLLGRIGRVTGNHSEPKESAIAG
jgi:hypothetical protein